jgi:hypothetical protein
MPHYEIHHSCPLINYQYETLSNDLTDLHRRFFANPSACTLITFHAAKTPPDAVYPDKDTQYMSIGGTCVWTNYINVHLKPGHSKEKLEELASEINKAWNMCARQPFGKKRMPIFGHVKAIKNFEENVQKADVDARGSMKDERSLHDVFIMEDIALHVAAYGAGE